ncbi:MAG: excinuclease ABC subunit UvrA, partial [Candidatus Omnitrophica bacterium]|nr:excinuclease ABC subunit UvrA [Candidatus Omnitrophota bacterium]
IEGLSPVIAIEQRTAGGSPRSIVATQTEIYDYLRVLYARIGKVHCHICGKPITTQTSQEIIEKVTSLPDDTKIYILSPVIRGKKGQYHALFAQLLKDGFMRVRVDGEVLGLDTEIKLEKYSAHNIEILVDRIKVSAANHKRVADAIETALRYSKGLVLVRNESENKELLYNTKFSCPSCDVSINEIEPRLFSFNAPEGICKVCNGLGRKLEFDQDLIVPDRKISISDGAIPLWYKGTRGYIMYYKSILRGLSNAMGFSLDVPFNKLPRNVKKTLFYGNDEIYVWNKPFEGLIPHLERLLRTSDSDYMKTEITKYMSTLPCPECKGARLRKEALSVYVAGKSIWDVIRMSIGDCTKFFKSLKFTAMEEQVAGNVIKEILKRLTFCDNVGLGYLSLDRLSSTLSGGEAQRIRLATQVGASLSGVLYVLDEPTIGLHSRDDIKLITTLQKLRELDNTVIVVEHDEQMIDAADWVVELGPGAGLQGGEVVFNGSREALSSADTLTARYIQAKESIALPENRRDYKKNKYIKIINASEHNLKNINVDIPLGVFVCVTGVSGSGKSTLVEDILYRMLAKKLYRAREKPGKCDKITGTENIDKIIIVDQQPIGRTPRSNPATYTGVYTHIRQLFSNLEESRARGYKPARFSFNVSGGRCEACGGEGQRKIEMHFLPDVYVPCEVCDGKRFNNQTLEVKYRGKNVHNVLEMSVNQALEFFDNFTHIKNILKTLQDVGLGYITLGQAATTLSGGEAQRMKLASQLRKRETGKTLYILDEPTTGLHFEDIKKLLSAIQRLVDKKNTVLIIEHNLDIIKSADYIIDLGPDGGDGGGEVVACGTPEAVAKNKRSFTGKYLKDKLRTK